MILDETNLFSDQQAITETAASTNVIDLGADRGDIGVGVPIPLLIQVTEDFATLTSLTIDVEVDDNSSFSSPTDVVSVTVPAASLVAGYQAAIQYVPKNVNERYLRLNYTVTGSNATAGKITAGISMGNQNGF